MLETGAIWSQAFALYRFFWRRGPESNRTNRICNSSARPLSLSVAALCNTVDAACATKQSSGAEILQQLVRNARQWLGTVLHCVFSVPTICAMHANCLGVILQCAIFLTINPTIPAVCATDARLLQRTTQRSAPLLRCLTDTHTLLALLFCTALLALTVALLLQSLSVSFNILFQCCNA